MKEANKDIFNIDITSIENQTKISPVTQLPLSQNIRQVTPTDTVSTLVRHGGSTVAVILAMSIFVLAIAKFSKIILSNK